MSETPGDPTPQDTDIEARLKELESMKASVEAERNQLAADREQQRELNATMQNIANALNAPEPEEDEPLPENYDENTLRAAGQVAKKMLESYHKELSPYLQNLSSGAFEGEWERVKSSDPKNFSRMEKTMRDYFDKHPEAKLPGAVERLFVQMRGTHFKKLQEMDAADRQAELETTPDPGTAPKPKGNVENDTLNADELRVLRGMREVHPEDYFIGRYGRLPNFTEEYLAELGWKPKERD